MPLSDSYSNNDPCGGYPVGSFGKGRSVTPADGSDLPDGPCRGFQVTVAGNVAVILVGDTASITIPSCSAGVVYPWACKRILSTGTTATGIIAGY